jgi:hypothetical protein
MRIRHSYVYWNYSDTDPIGKVLKTANSAVITFLQKLLQVATTTITIYQTTCVDITIPTEDRNVQLPYDFISYITTGPAIFMVGGLNCQLRSSPARTVVGRLKFNPSKIPSVV